MADDAPGVTCETCQEKLHTLDDMIHHMRLFHGAPDVTTDDL